MVLYICSNKSSKHAVIPYEEDYSKAQCAGCSNDMDLTKRHTIWFRAEVPVELEKQLTICGMLYTCMIFYLIDIHFLSSSFRIRLSFPSNAN